MGLLDIPLPELRLRIDEDPAAFFDVCEQVARAREWAIDRRREYAGPAYDQLNLYTGPSGSEYPMILMVSVPSEPKRLRVDVIDEWRTTPIDYDEYLTTANKVFGQLLAGIKRLTGKQYRLGVPRRPVAVDVGSLNCQTIRYAAGKLRGLCRQLAVAPGDARDRLIGAYHTIHPISPTDLPEPLRAHLAHLYAEITKRPARHTREGAVEATVRTMKNATAARVLERLLCIADAVAQLEEYCVDTGEH
jgi:hypothetical protein